MLFLTFISPRKSQQCTDAVLTITLSTAKSHNQRMPSSSFSRCHPGTLGDTGVRLLQLQLGEGAHQPQRHRALLWRERQAAALLRHVEERLRHRGGRQARLLAGRCQLLRQVRRKQQNIPERRLEHHQIKVGLSTGAQGHLSSTKHGCPLPR